MNKKVVNFHSLSSSQGKHGKFKHIISVSVEYSNGTPLSLLSRIQHKTDNDETFWNVDDKSFGSIAVLDGNLSLSCKDESLSLNKGDTAFIDAGSGKVYISGEGEFIFARV